MTELASNISGARSGVSAQIVTIGSIGICHLCPTHWRVRAEALASIAENYITLYTIDLRCC